MVRTIRARFSREVLEPLEPEVGGVPEGEEVLITISTPGAPTLVDAIIGTGGGWKGLIDADELKRNIYGDRLIASRPHVTL
jgi:hypothetical protein